MQFRLYIRPGRTQKLGQFVTIVALYLFSIGVAQSRPVTTADGPVQGKIRDRKGDALVGVNVIVKVSSRGTTSDAEGHYTITAPNGGILVFGFLGTKPRKLPLAPAQPSMFRLFRMIRNDLI